MSQTVENKVVEFQFNNSNFEKNVKTSMSTLDKLKEKLKFDGATKSFSDIEKAARNFDISNVGKSADAVANNFNALEAIAVGALHKIGAQAIELGQELVNSLAFEQMSAGFDKYTKNTEAVATIMNATGESVEYVDEQLADLLEYTDKTSYNYAALVDNVSKFTALQVPLEDAVKALEGVGNLAALSGVSAQSEKASNAMYTFTNAIAMGKMSLKQWRSIENATMATAQFKQELIDTAIAMGTLDEQGFTEKGNYVDAIEGFSATLADSWLTAEVLTETLKRFSDETTEVGQKAYIAASEAKTFADAVGAVKDALSTGWMQSYVTVLGNYTESAKLWTDLQDYFLDVLTPGMQARNELLTQSMRNTSWSQMVDEMKAAGVSADIFQESIVNAARNHGIAIDEIMANEKDFAEVLRQANLSTNIYQEAIGSIPTDILRYAASLDTADASLTDFEKVTRRFMAGEFGDEQEAFREISALGFDANAVIADGNARLQDFAFGISTFSDAELEAAGVTIEQIRLLRNLAQQAKDTSSPIFSLIKGLQKKSGRILLIESLYNAFDAVRKILETVKEAWFEIFNPLTADDIYNIVQAIHDFTERMIMSDETADKLKRTFKGVFAALDIVAQLLSTTFKVAFETIGRIFGDTKVDVLDLTGTIGDNIVAFREWLNENNFIREGLEKLADVVVKVVDGIKNFIEKLLSLPLVQEVFSTIRSTLSDIVTWITDWVNGTDTLDSKWESFSGKVGEVFKSIKDWADRTAKSLGLDVIFEKIGTAVSKFWQTLKNFFSNDPLGQIKNFIDSFTGINKIDASGFDTKVVSVFDRFSNFVQKAWSGLIEMGEKAGIKLGAVGSAIKGVFSGIWGTIKKVFSYIGEHPGLVFSALLSGTLAIAIFNVSKALVNFSNGFRSVNKMISGIGSALSGFGFYKKAAGIGYILDSLGKLIAEIVVLVGVISTIAEYTDADIDKGISVLWKIVGMISVLMIVNGVLSKLPGGGGGGGISTKNTGLVNITNNMSDLVGVAAAMVAVANSLAVIGNIPEDRLKGAVWAMTFMVLELAGLMIVLNKFPASGTVGGALSIAAMGVGLKLMADSINEIATIDSADVKKGLATLLGLVIELSLLLASVSGIGFGTGIGLLGIVVSIRLLIGIFDDIAELDYATINKSFDFLLKLFGDFLVLGLAARLAGDSSLMFAALALSMGVSIKLIADAMKILSDMSVSDIEQAGIAIGAIMAAMVILMGLSRFSGGGLAAGVMLLGVGTSLILIAKAAKMMQDIPPKDLLKVTLVIDSIIVAMSVLLRSAKSVGAKIGSVIALTGAIIALVLAVTGLSYVAQENERGLLVAAGSVAALMAAFALMTYATGSSNGVNYAQIVLLGLIVAGLSYILIQMAAVAKDVEMGIETAGSLALLLVAMAATIAILNKFGTGSTSGMQSAILAMTELTGILILIMAAIAIINDNGGKIEMSLSTVASLSALLLALAVTLAIINNFGTGANFGSMQGAMLAMAELGLVLVGLMAAIAYIDYLGGKIELSITTAIALGVLLASLSASLLILNKIGAVRGSLFLAVLALGLLIVELTAIAVGIGAAFNKWSSLKDSLKTGLEALQMLGEGLGKALGAFIGGIFEGVMSTLPAIGTYLSDFWDNAGPFFDGVSGMGQDLVDSVGHLAAAILALTAANVLSGFSAIVGSVSLGGVGKQLSEFAPGLVDFAAQMKSVDTVGLKNAAEAAEHLGNFMNALPREGGLWQGIVGTVDMEGFAESIGPMGEGLKKFSDEVQGVDSAAVKEGADAAQSVAALASNMEAHGGALQWFLGEKEGLDEFGITLRSFGISLKIFSKQSKQIDGESVENAATAGGHLADLANNLQRHNGILQTFIGDNSLSDFGREITTFGIHLKLFSDKAKDISPGYVYKAAVAGGYMADLANSLNAHGGVIKSVFTGDYTLIEFGKDMELFANSLKRYSKDISGENSIDTEAMNNVSTAVEKIIEMSNMLGDAPSLFNNVQTIGDLGQDLVVLGTSLGSYSEAVKPVNVAKIDLVSESVKKMCEILGNIETVDADNLGAFSRSTSSLGSAGVDAFLEAFTDCDDKIQSAVFTFLNNMIIYVDRNRDMLIESFTELMQFVVDGLDEFDIKFENAGKSFINTISRGVADNRNVIPKAMRAVMDDTLLVFDEFDFAAVGSKYVEDFRQGAGDYTPTVASKFIALTNDAINSIRSKYQSMYDAGAFLAQGLANGIAGKTSTVTKAASNLGDAVAEEEWRSLNLGSPSRLTYQMGVYWDQGLANAINDYAYLAKYASDNLADDVIESTADVIAAIDNVMSEGTDFDPVITPIMDLSEIQNGTSKINDLLGTGTYSIAGAMNMSDNLIRSIGKIDAQMTQQQETATQPQANYNNTFENTFNIESSDPYAVADRISEILQSQVERSNAVWA